jgi:ribokinase
MSSKGTLLIEGERVQHFGALPVPAIETTGAGDAFCGATASALASGHSLEVAVKRANRFAADSTTRRRALDSHVVERERSEDCSPATCQ